jgi:hypothetical protein
MAGDVYNLADKEQAGYFPALHGLSGEFVGVDSPSSDLSLLIAFGGGRRDRPPVNLAFELGESCIRPLGWHVKFEPAIGETAGKKLA